MNDKGGVAWNMDNWDFLLQGKDYDSIHPSLQRQALLNMEYGLYEVVPGIYQVRGFDLANISFIKGKTGWIVIDPLTVKETARAALQFVNETAGRAPGGGRDHLPLPRRSLRRHPRRGGREPRSRPARCRSSPRTGSCTRRSRRTSSPGTP
jgi:hypothetical protein